MASEPASAVLALSESSDRAGPRSRKTSHDAPKQARLGTRSGADDAGKKPRRRRRTFAALGALSAAGLAGVVLMAPRDPMVRVAAPPPLVRTVVVAAAAAEDARYTGTVRARYESGLGFRVAGKILQRLVDPGDRVRKGQPLARLDPTDFALALRGAQSAVEAARATAKQAASDEVRRRALAERGWISKQAYERDKALADSSAAQLASALAQEHQIEDQARYAVLVADTDGVIMEVQADPGQVVAVGQPVVRLAHDGAREAEVYLPEGLERQAGGTASASLYSDPKIRFPARRREISAAADPLTRTYRARYVLEGEGRNVPLGATVTLRLPASGKPKSGFEVPAAAVFDDGRGPEVWVVDVASSRVAPRHVRLIHVGDEQTRIAGDLKAGERIVALGAHLLKRGQKIAVAPAAIGVAAR